MVVKIIVTIMTINQRTSVPDLTAGCFVNTAINIVTKIADGSKSRL